MPIIPVAVGIDQGPLAEVVSEVVEEQDVSLSVFYNIIFPETSPSNMHTVVGDVGRGQVVGRGARYRGGEGLCGVPVADLCTTAGSTHTDVVGGLGSKTGELNVRIIYETGDGVGGEVRGSAVLVFPCVAVGRAGPADFRTVRPDFGDSSFNGCYARGLIVVAHEQTGEFRTGAANLTEEAGVGRGGIYLVKAYIGSGINLCPKQLSCGLVESHALHIVTVSTSVAHKGEGGVGQVHLVEIPGVSFHTVSHPGTVDGKCLKGVCQISYFRDALW